MNTLGYDAITEEARKTIKVYMNLARMYEGNERVGQIAFACGAFKLWSNLTVIMGDQQEKDRRALQMLLND